MPVATKPLSFGRNFDESNLGYSFSVAGAGKLVRSNGSNLSKNSDGTATVPILRFKAKKEEKKKWGGQIFCMFLCMFKNNHKSKKDLRRLSVSP
ncbi:MAG: hypothetical protein PHP85_04060 [Gallionella sp.]|nr:hypothetical protein [Gallionella sp.]